MTAQWQDTEPTLGSLSIIMKANDPTDEIITKTRGKSVYSVTIVLNAANGLDTKLDIP